MVTKKRKTSRKKSSKFSISSLFTPKKNTKKRTKKSKTNKKNNIILSLIWLFMVFILSLSIWLLYCYQTLPDIEKAIYVERQRGVKILASNSKEITSYGASFATPVTLDELPYFVHQAIIDTEDRRFYKHKGIDYIGFIRAMFINLIKLRYAQGASTITQQVAKNLFLTSEKSLKRKTQEYIIAQKLEKHFSKKQILEIYINRVFFGYGTYGINSASQKYFNKPAKELNLREAAILAGSLKAPSKYNYFANKELALKRAQTVLSLMNRAGTITKEEQEKANQLPITDHTKESILGVRYFGDYVMSEVYNITNNTSNEDIFIKTTLDWNLQQRTEYLLRKTLRENISKNVTEGAVVILDKTGAIKAMAGGFDYKKSQFNRATLATRQAGSSFKLFVYLSAFEKGFDTEELISDEPLNINGWQPKNYDKKHHGAVTLKYAFSKSLNLATLDLATYIGLSDIIDIAYRLGISTTIENTPSIILGATEVKVIDMAQAYGVIFNNGYSLHPYVIDKIYNTNNEILYSHPLQEQHQLLSQDVVKKAKIILREVVTNGTGKNASSIKNAHGKTGTTQNYRDAWFVGFNDKYVCAVWLGNDDNKPMHQITGGGLATTLWKEILK